MFGALLLLGEKLRRRSSLRTITFGSWGVLIPTCWHSSRALVSSQAPGPTLRRESNRSYLLLIASFAMGENSHGWGIESRIWRGKTGLQIAGFIPIFCTQVQRACDVVTHKDCTLDMRQPRGPGRYRPGTASA